VLFPLKCRNIFLYLFVKTCQVLSFSHIANQYYCPTFIFTHCHSLSSSSQTPPRLSVYVSVYPFSPSCAWLVPQRNRNLRSNLIILHHSAELQVFPQSRLDYAALYVQLYTIGFFIHVLLCYKTFKLISNEVMASLSNLLMIK
jgi:hypothetical protein